MASTSIAQITCDHKKTAKDGFGKRVGTDERHLLPAEKILNLTAFDYSRLKRA